VSKVEFDMDGFINDLYKQSIFWFNGCLNASLIIYCHSKISKACKYCFMLANKALQYHLLTESFGVAIYDTNETGHVAIISNLWQPNIYRGDRWFHL
jgi:hypothetical protein